MKTRQNIQTKTADEKNSLFGNFTSHLLQMTSLYDSISNS